MKLLLVFLLLCLPAIAEKRPEPVYQGAVLKSYHTVQSGMHCSTSGNTTGSVDATGSYDGNTSSNTNCRPRTHVEYTVLVGEQTLVVEPALSGSAKAGAALSLGWSRVFAKDSCLYGQLPGTHIQIRAEGGIFHIKTGKRESLYKLVSAE